MEPGRIGTSVVDEAHAFLSYTHLDDEGHDGAITELRKRLERSVRVATGDPSFTIFQDHDGITFGQHWPSRLDEALAGARFLVPVLSPSFFKSGPCRDELAKFLELERRAGRRDLILPLYLVTTPVLEQPARRAADPLAQAISERQRHDWRPYVHLAADHPDHRRAIFELATAIAGALDRFEAPPPPPPAPQPIRPPEPPPPADPLLTPGTIFRDIDAPWCPEMVTLPTGSFVMGSAANEEGRSDYEGPQHRVELRHRVALGRYPVTFAEYDRFCEATGRERPDDLGWGRDRRPVIFVSWDDATAYCAWLSGETGEPYRLPSEAEWEYACRAGTTTRYWWGDAIGRERANYGESGKGRTTEVGTYPANPWGLYEMHGNVWEWVGDHWHGNYQGAPTDGSAWLNSGGGGVRVLRGGSWDGGARYCRAASRGRGVP